MCVAAHLLTAARLVLLLPILLLLGEDTSPGRHWLAFWLFLLAALTDFLDGWAARRGGCAGAIGTFFDPLADKVVTNLLLVFLACRHPHWVPLWMVLTLLARELTVQALRSMAPYVGVLIRTDGLSKLKLVLQMIAIGSALAGLGWEAGALILQPLTGLALAGALIAGLWSMLALLWQHRDLWRRTPLPLEQR